MHGIVAYTFLDILNVKKFTSSVKYGGLVAEWL